MIVLNVINPISAGVKLDGSAADAWTSLMTLNDAKSDLGLLQAEEEPNSIKYRDDSNIEAHFRALCTVWSKANDQGAAIDDKHFRAYVIKSMPSMWAPVTGALFEMKTSADVIARLTTHALLLHGPAVVAPVNCVHVLVTQMNKNRSDKPKCDNCNQSGHTKDKCFCKDGGMEGQYPEWWRKSKSAPNSTSTMLTTTQIPTANSVDIVPIDNVTTLRCLALTTLANTPNREKIIIYADSTASHHFFTDHADFMLYSQPDPVDTAGVTAEEQKFCILETGRVYKWSVCDGEMIKMTFNNALHAPDLAYNLISLGSLIKKGVKVGLENGGAVLTASNGKPFMRCKMEGTMFVVNFAQPPAALSAHSLT